MQLLMWAPHAACPRRLTSWMQDAADFSRAVDAARGNYSHAIRICADTMPHLTEDQIRVHACWHREMTELASGKRDALHR